MLLLLLLSRFSRVQICATPETTAHQAPPSLGFSRQKHWSGLPFPSPMHESEKWKWSRSVVSDSSRPHGLQPTRLLRLWDFPGKSTGVGCHYHFILWHPLLFLPSVFPSIKVISNESALLIRWPKYWSFSFSISPFSEYSGLISFRIDWFDLFVVQGTLRSLLQYQDWVPRMLRIFHQHRDVLELHEGAYQHFGCETGKEKHHQIIRMQMLPSSQLQFGILMNKIKLAFLSSSGP